MHRLPRNYLIVLGLIIVALVTACQGENIPATPDVNALLLWGNKDSSVSIKARLGNGATYALAISPDGKTLAVAGIFGLSVYNFNTLKEIWRSPLKLRKDVPGHGVTVVWSPDGSRLATSSAGKISVWDASTGKMLSEFKDNEHYVTCIAWAPDKDVLAAGIFQNTAIILWDTQTEKQISVLETGDAVKSLDWMPQGGILAAGLAHGAILVLDTHTGKQLYAPLKDPDSYSYIHSVKWSADGTRLASGGEAGRVIMWDFQSGKQLFAHQGSSVKTVAWSPNNELLAAGLMDGTVIVLDARTGKQFQKMKRKQIGLTEEVLSLVWSPNGKNLISMSQYEPITVWDAYTGKEIRSLGDHTGSVISLAWSPDANRLAMGSEDGEIIIWNPQIGKKLLTCHDPDEWVMSLAWSPDGKRLASGDFDKIIIWEAQTCKQLKVLTKQSKDHGITGIAWSPDGKRLVSISRDGHGIIWDGTTYEPLHDLYTGGLFSASRLTWSPQGEWLAIGTLLSFNPFDSKVSIWDPQTGETVRSKSGFSDGIWSPVSDILISRTDATTLVLWDARTGKETRKFSMNFGEEEFKYGMYFAVFDLDWSPDGKILLIAERRSLFILDAQTGEQIHTLEGHADAITEAAWSPRGDLVAAASKDGTVIIWGVNPH
jgi:WD40 repeat protein